MGMENFVGRFTYNWFMRTLTIKTMLNEIYTVQCNDEQFENFMNDIYCVLEGKLLTVSFRVMMGR